MASKIGTSSPGAPEMTRNTSAVAVCCSNDFAQLAHARLNLVKQSHVLDRDHRLVGEGGGQFNLLVGERSRSRARHSQYADRIPFAQERDSKNGTVAGDIQDPGRSVLGIGLAILDVNWTPSEQDPASTGVTPRPEGKLPHRLFVPRRLAEICGNCVHVTVGAYYARCFGIAQATRRLHKRIEYGLQIERRAADDLKHVGGRGLLLQRFAQLIEQACVLDRNDGLGGEVRDQLDVLVGEGTDFLTKDGNDSNELIVLEHRNIDGGPNTTELDGIHHHRVTLFIRFRCRQIEEVGRLLGSNRLAESATRGGMERTSSACLGKAPSSYR